MQSQLPKKKRNFVNNCLYCIVFKSGSRKLRLLGSGINVNKPVKILHFDYLYLCSSSCIEKYVLALKDDLSSYCWLEPVDGVTSENSALILTQWNRIFTATKIWVSDQGPLSTQELKMRLMIMKFYKSQPLLIQPLESYTVQYIM